MRNLEEFPPTPFEELDEDDAPELTDEMIDRAVWMRGDQVISREEGLRAFAEKLRRGRPKAERTKVAMSMRFDADILEYFRATGKGWQTRMNDALREWMKEHPRLA